MRKLTVLTIAAFVFLISCKKTEVQQPADDLAGIAKENLTEADNAFLESISVPTPPLQSLLNHNGMPLGRLTGTQSAVGNLIDGLLREAQALSAEKTSTLHPAGDSTQPEHRGYAYSKGGKDLTLRLKPPLFLDRSGREVPGVSNALHRKYAVFGTDCSGFIYNIFNRRNVPVPYAPVETFEANLREFFRSNATYSGLPVVNLGRLSRSSIRRGDFILWIGGGRNHIGIVGEMTNGSGLVFQSNGTGTPANQQDQNKNLGLGRGIHPISLENCLNAQMGYWGTGYHILRLRDTLLYNLTNDSVKKWKVNPQGVTNYCGQSAVNPVVAMDDIFIFNANGTFSHRGGAVTVDPNLSNCSDGGNYSGNWAFNSDRTAIIFDRTTSVTIVRIEKNRLIIGTPGHITDMIPN